MEGEELISAINAKQMQDQRAANTLHLWKIRRFMVSRWSVPPIVDSVEVDGQIYRV